MEWQDWFSLYRFHARHRGPVRGFVRSLRKHHQRYFSRALIQKYISPTARGLELGAGEQTIAPLRQTVLSDAYAMHAGARSLAREFFPAEAIPYPDAHFDFVLNEHVLEHLPNPLKALREWKRVLKSHGFLFLFLPHPERTFDRYRKTTLLEHLHEDLGAEVNSREDRHWSEWEEEVVKKGLVPHYEKYGKEESLRNNLLHRHVFTPESMKFILESEGWALKEGVAQVPDREDSFCWVAQKPE